MDLEDLALASMDDPAAMNRLLSRLGAELPKAVRKWVCEADVEDVVQNTLFAVSRKLASFTPRGPGSFLRWVRGFVRIEVQEQVRRRHRHDRLCQAVARTAPTPSTSLTSRVERRRCVELMKQEAAKLPPPQHRAIVSELQGGDAAGLAASESISRAYARLLRSRARRNLRRRVELLRLQM